MSKQLDNAVKKASEILAEQAKRYEEARKAMQEQLQDEMKVAFASFFESHPEVLAFYWNQYTPVFNDGEPCTFGRNDTHVLLDNDEIFEDGEETYTAGDPWNGIDWSELPEAWSLDDKSDVKKFMNILGSIPDDVYEGMFGNNVQVVVDRAGFHIEEYDCGY